jgi:hypothetical protein
VIRAGGADGDELGEMLTGKSLGGGADGEELGEVLTGKSLGLVLMGRSSYTRGGGWS